MTTVTGFFCGFRQKVLAFSVFVLYNSPCTCRCDGIGRRSGLKIHRQRWRTGSSPVTGTIKETSFVYQGKRGFFMLVGAITAKSSEIMASEWLSRLFRSPFSVFGRQNSPKTPVYFWYFFAPAKKLSNADVRGFERNRCSNSPTKRSNVKKYRLIVEKVYSLRYNILKIIISS